MRIAVSSQNFRTVTGHAGKTRRFILFDITPGSEVRETSRLDLPIEMAMHGFGDHQPHPLDQADVLITAGAGDGFVRRMGQRGIRVLTTTETDPEAAVHAYLMGCLKPIHHHVHAHEQLHHHHADGSGGCACSCSA